MADYGSLQSPNTNYRQPTSSIFTSPKLLFTNFASKTSNETNNIIITSPTSILDIKPISSPKMDSRTVSLGLLDALIDDNPGPNLSKMLTFGSHLKIQVPPLLPSVSISPDHSPKSSPGDFGIKTRNTQLYSPSPVRKSPFGSSDWGGFRSLSASEMELSEDYTCVISYGPNPRTTHIFDDCIVESCCGVVRLSESRKENEFLEDRSFLSFCYKCNKNLGQGKDIYMYRGEKAFCSSECRYKEMLLEDEVRGIF